MSLSNTYEGKMLDHLFDLAALTAPSIYIGLSTADPLDDGSGLAEPADAAYARVEVAAWTRTVSEVANTSDFSFAEATESQGTLTHLVAFDIAAAGDATNIIFSFILDSSLAVDTGDQVTFHAGNCSVIMD